MATTPGVIRLNAVVTGGDNPAYQISQDEWNDDLVVEGGSDGDILVRDSSQPDGWGWQSYSAIEPITTEGDLIIGDASGVASRLPIGAAGTVLSSNGTTGSWSASPTLTSLTVSGNLLTSGATSNIGSVGNPFRFLYLLPSGSGALRFGAAGSPQIYAQGTTGINLDGTTVNVLGGALSVGSSPSQTGDIRLRYNGYIYSRNSSNASDLNLLALDTISSQTNTLVLSGGATPILMNTTGLTQFTGVTSSYPALKRSATSLQVVLADGSALTDLVAGSLTVGLATAATGVIRLGNTANIYSRNAANSGDIFMFGVGTDDKLQIGTSAIFNSGFFSLAGTTSSFPALKRSSTTLQARLADDSAYTLFQASNFIASEGSGQAASAGSYRAVSGFTFKARNNANSADLTLLSTNSTDGMLIGGTNVANYGWGGAADANAFINVGGQLSAATGGTYGMLWRPTLIPGNASNVGSFRLSSVLRTHTSGNHTLISNLHIDAISVSMTGTATITDTAQLYIGGAMTATVTGVNYAMWVVGGKSRFDDMLLFSGASNACPALKRNSTELQVRLADDSGYTDVVARCFHLGNTDGTSYYQMAEQATAPAAPPTNFARLFAQDNGAGKTQLAVRFPTGAVQVLATEP